MRRYVHCSPVYNSKDLEPTQILINVRLEKENVVHIHHGILHSYKNWWVLVLCRDLNESGNHHSQKTDTRTENQTPHVLTHRRVLMRTHGHGEGNITHWGMFRRDSGGRGGWGGRAQGEMPDVGDGGMETANHHGMCLPIATILQDLHMYPRT